MKTAYSRGPLVATGKDGDYYLEELSSVHEEELSSLISKDETASNIVSGESDGYFKGMAGSPGYHWVVMHGSPAEICGLVSIEAGDFAFCDHNLAVWMKRNHRGRNVAYRAICLALNMAGEDGVSSVESKIHEDNRNTLYLMDKVSETFDCIPKGSDGVNKTWTIMLPEVDDG